MRLFAVTPIHVPDAELARRQQRYDRLSPPGISVHLHDIGPDAPTALDTPNDIEASEKLVQRALTNAGPGYDGLLPDCVLDPGVSALSGTLPVFGILRLSMGYALATGRPCGALARNPVIADALKAQVAAYGWSSHLAGVEVLGLEFDAIADDTAWNAAVAKATGSLSSRGVEWIINACSAVDVEGAVDPVAKALALLGAGELV
jgi:Asp/Glu/hydantoin racemase